MTQRHEQRGNNYDEAKEAMPGHAQRLHVSAAGVKVTDTLGSLSATPASGEGYTCIRWIS